MIPTSQASTGHEGTAMSYLNPLRLHFAGRFQAAVSTVNNDPAHYDNATFQKQYQDPAGPNFDPPNGWWNPRGDADWRLIGCRVTAAFLADGRAADPGDPVLKCTIADSDRKVPAKLVDLDTEQQLVSEVWGLEVRVADDQGNTLVRGHFEPAAFHDIWDRALGGTGGDIAGGAAYQSVLSQLAWGAIDGSPFLNQLRDSARDGLLSIKFNVDGYNMDSTAAEFTRGRIVGTIGQATAAEPRHLVAGRHLMATAALGGNFFKPQGQINFCPAVVVPAAGKIYLDLGNALPTTVSGGPMAPLGTLSMACDTGPDPQGNDVLMPLGEIAYDPPGWYEQTAGVVEVPPGRRLTTDELTAVASHPLVLTLTGPSGTAAPATSEFPTGVHARADQFVFRLNPGQQAVVRVFATRFGQPYSAARILAILDPSQLQGPTPPVAQPAAAVEFPARVVADAGGVASLPIQASDPGLPRAWIDGQVYGVRPMLEETLSPGTNYPFNPWDFISLLVWSGFHPDEPPTWLGSLQPIFQQYANLYPIMDRFLKLDHYESVAANRRLLLLAFGLDPADPNSMPVTRDLSDAKRRTILRWLTEVGPDGKPLLGESIAPAAQVVPSPAPGQPAAAGIPAGARGGKAAAASRRLGTPGARRRR
jgi:hypothetical protein